MEERKWCVYKHTSPSNKVYIGITCQNPEKRWKNGYGYTQNNHFWNAIQKYGWDSFEHEIIQKNISKELACQIEKELIEKLLLSRYLKIDANKEKSFERE